MLGSLTGFGEKGIRGLGRRTEEEVLRLMRLWRAMWLLGPEV